MKRFASLCVVTACFSFAAAADDFKPEEGFASLFNGKDLTGWEGGHQG
jgi:hypothetical protein